MKRGLALAAAILLVSGMSARALDKVRVGTSGTAIIWTLIEMGQAAKIWESVGLDVEWVSLAGDAPLQQALTSNSIDFGCGSGPGMGYRTKGVPALAVAALAGPPYSFVLVSQPDSGLKSFADLKGRKIGVTTAGSMTDWLAREMSRREGWGPEGVQSLPLGAGRTRLAALKAREIDASVVTDQEGFSFEEHKDAVIIGAFGDIVKDFHTHVLFVRDDIREKNPDLVRRYLQGWFRTVAWAKAHRAEGVKIAAKALNHSDQTVDRAWDNEMRMLSDDGAFSPAALDVISRSLKELGMLDHVPDPKLLYTSDFTPVKY
jgi:ABC-type nitrate/sulfonate/bicarbonate transport system substrate-binding protein